MARAQALVKLPGRASKAAANGSNLKERYKTMWKKYNANPSGANIRDCIVRAMCTALPLTYEQAKKLLTDKGAEIGYKFNQKITIKNALEELGVKLMSIKSRQVQFGKFSDTADNFVDGVRYILVSCNHAAAVIDGVLYDTWDSTKRWVQDIWIITPKMIKQISEKFNPKKEEDEKMDYKKIFAAAKTLEELKKAYKKACLQYHPDKGGSPAEFKAMQADYEQQAARIARQEAGGNYRHNQKADGTYKTAEELYSEDKAFRAVLDKILGLDGLEIEVCGNWLWIGGNTYEHRAALKEAGCKFASKKKMWYWQPGDWVKKAKGTLSMDKIRDLHGSEKIQPHFIPPAPAHQPYMPSLF